MATVLSRAAVQAAKAAKAASKGRKSARKKQKNADNDKKDTRDAEYKPIEKVGSKNEQSVQAMRAEDTRNSSVKPSTRTKDLEAAAKESKEVGAMQGLTKYPKNDAARYKYDQAERLKRAVKKTEREQKSTERMRKREDPAYRNRAKSTGRKYEME